jgi:hypothetical protein
MHADRSAALSALLGFIERSLGLSAQAILRSALRASIAEPKSDTLPGLNLVCASRFSLTDPKVRPAPRQIESSPLILHYSYRAPALGGEERVTRNPQPATRNP